MHKYSKSGLFCRQAMQTNRNMHSRAAQSNTHKCNYHIQPSSEMYLTSDTHITK